MRQSFSLLGGALLAALPLAALLTGCGGGGGGLIGTETPTPAPTTAATATATSTTPTPTATATSIALGSAPVVFSNSQIGTLSLTRKGTVILGTLVVNEASGQLQARRSTQAFNFSLAAGTYQVSGTFTAPRSFSITGNFPAPIGSFSISGTIPTTTATGSYTITAGGQTVTGTYPKISTTTPTATPTGTTPPVGNGGSFSGTIASSSDANFGTTAFQPATFSGTKSTQGSITVFAVGATEASQVNGYVRGLVITLSSASGGFTQGQVLPATALSSPTIPNAHVIPSISPTSTTKSAGSWGNFTVKSGSVTVSALTSTSITLIAKNVQVVGDIGSAKGTLTVNGTIKANYKSL